MNILSDSYFEGLIIKSLSATFPGAKAMERMMASETKDGLVIKNISFS